MKIITKQASVVPSINYFLNNYRRYSGSNAPFYTKERFDRISSLNPSTCTVEQFNTALGNTSWTDLKCDECGNNVDMLVQVGQEPDYESSTANVCVKCLRKAVCWIDS